MGGVTLSDSAFSIPRWTGGIWSSLIKPDWWAPLDLTTWSCVGEATSSYNIVVGHQGLEDFMQWSSAPSLDR